MQHKLCSEGFYQIFEALKKSYSSAEELFASLTVPMAGVAQELGIGRFEIMLKVPASVLEPQGKEGGMVVYECPDGYESEQMWMEQFPTGNSGSVVFTVMPRRAKSWTEEEEEALSVLAQTILAFGGRLRMGNLLKASLEIDNLTGALNTRGLMQYGGMLCEQKRIQEFTAIFLNLKNFKYINTRVGARVGDRILAEYVRKNKEFLEEGEIIARPGGDNFFLMLKNDRVQEYLKYATPLIVTVPMENGEQREFELRAKMGVYAFHAWDTIGDVMNYTSIALSVARSHHRSQDVVWYMPQMLEQSMHSRAILNAFPKALARKEFQVYFQPKVNLQTQELCGAEALARWARVDRVVQPIEFVPVLEREGLICQLDFYVFEEICKAIRGWLDAGITPVRISTNFSKVHLSNHDLAEWIIGVMEKYNVDPAYVEIELTEMSGEEDFEAMSEFIRRVRAEGISVSIDDFGTGYSTLNMLKDLEVDVIKLDKSFLSNLEQERKADQVVIKNIISMIQELEMTVLAEGVENWEQLRFLKKMKCAVVQGYLFDRPLMKEEFEMRLKQRRNYSNFGM